MNEQFGTSDGEIVFEPQQPLSQLPTDKQSSEYLGMFIQDLSSKPRIEYRRSESPGATVWSIACDVSPSVNNEAVVDKLALGFPSDFVRNFALVRIWSPWLAPRHGRDRFRLTERAILLSFLRRDGLNLVLLAVSGLDNVLTLFESGDNGEIIVTAQNDNGSEATAHVLAAIAPSFEIANAAVMYEARKMVRQSELQLSKEVIVPRSTENENISPQWISSWYDSLGYCTWNALGANLTEDKILNALDTLAENGIKIGNLILDDNWQSLDNDGGQKFERGMTRFEANKEGFPHGIKHTIGKIREKFPKIHHIAVWHALLGYWGGISPGSEIDRNYKTIAVDKIDKVAGGTMTAVDPDDVFRFYEDFYSFLSSAGINSVKTDAQFFLDILAKPESRTRFMTAYQDAWSISSLRFFQAKAISCMSQTPQIIFHSQMPTSKPQILLRTSDDFFPDVMSSHPWHVFCNAHNALLTQHLNVVPDWDMFQTHHPYASFHAASRCVSGGVIYITDEPGKHDFGLVNQMTAQTIQGDTVILRPSVVGRSIDIYHNYNEGNALKIGTYNGRARTGSGILGLFNVSAIDKSLLVSLRDFPSITLDGNREYIIRAHTTGRIARVMRPLDAHSLVSVFLQQRGWEILTVFPIKTVTFPTKQQLGKAGTGNELQLAVLGLLGKMTGIAAVVDWGVTVLEDNTVRFDVSLKALGTLGLFISNLQEKSVIDHFMVLVSGKPVPVETVSMESGQDCTENVLSIDVERAWREMGLESGWSNEISVRVFMS